VLMMLQYGATGTTLRELSMALCDKTQPCENAAPNTHKDYIAANAVWVQEGLVLNPQYRSDIEKKFQGDIESVNFQKNSDLAVEQINAWAKKNTKGMITEVLKSSDINSGTAMVLANALYFQGFWPTQFDTQKTMDQEFTLLNGQKKNVPTMTKEDQYFVANINHTQLIGLPYRDSDLEMLVLMPENPKKFKVFVQSLTTKTINALVAAQASTKATLYLPKFSIESSYNDLTPNLQALGIHKVFTPQAELSKITDKKSIYLSKVLQKAIIQVDEKGTKAAAVTTGVMMRAVMMQPTILRVDRPFVFAIYDQKTHQFPFIGQVVNPRV
nr:serpin family protein [Pseudomonadota bacterium]